MSEEWRIAETTKKTRELVASFGFNRSESDLIPKILDISVQYRKIMPTKWNSQYYSTVRYVVSFFLLIL